MQRSWKEEEGMKKGGSREDGARGQVQLGSFINIKKHLRWVKRLFLDTVTGLFSFFKRMNVHKKEPESN